MGVRSPGNASDQFWGLDHAATVITAADDTELHSYLVPQDGWLVEWGHQVTVAVVSPDQVPTLSLEVTDYDDAANTVEADLHTIPTGTAAGNTIRSHGLNVAATTAGGSGSGYAVTAGQHVRIVTKLHAHGAGAAGTIRFFVQYRPAG